MTPCRAYVPIAAHRSRSICCSCGQAGPKSSRFQPAGTPPPPPSTAAAPNRRQAPQAAAPRARVRATALLIGLRNVFSVVRPPELGVLYGVVLVQEQGPWESSTTLAGMVGSLLRRKSRRKYLSLLSRDELAEVSALPSKNVEIKGKGSSERLRLLTNPAGFEANCETGPREARKQAESCEDNPASKSDNPATLLKRWPTSSKASSRTLGMSQGGDKEGRVLSVRRSETSAVSNWRRSGQQRLIVRIPEVKDRRSA